MASPEDFEQTLFAAVDAGHYNADTVAAMASTISAPYHGCSPLPQRSMDDLESHGRLIELGDGLYDLNGRCVGLIERCQGPSWGWTVGEALGATLESKRPGAFTPSTDRVGGGPFHPKASHSGSP